MCQRLRDILFPTNILGKDKRTIRFALPDNLTPVHLTIDWAGDHLECCYVERVVWHYMTPEPHTSTKKTPVHYRYNNTEQGTQEIDIYRGLYHNVSRTDVVDSCVYFKCTNVTSLIVNGETLI